MTFFHNFATQRNRSTIIRSLRNKDREEVSDVEEIRKIVKRFSQ